MAERLRLPLWAHMMPPELPVRERRHAGEARREHAPIL
jgi:hypothetical protein